MTIQSPISFISEKELPNFKLKYTNLMEIGQGGPEVGYVYIDEKKVPTYLFGGPFLLSGNYVYMPVYLKSFFYKGFKIAKVNIENLKVEILGSYENLINLYKIDDNYIYYYRDINDTQQGKLKIN
jgi:hypothetical protein